MRAGGLNVLLAALAYPAVLLCCAAGWEDDEPAGPGLDPWEQGYDAADGEQLPEADQHADGPMGVGSNGGWVAEDEDAVIEAEGAGGEEEEQQQQQQQAGGGAPEQRDAAAGGAAAQDGSDDEWEDDEEEEGEAEAEACGKQEGQQQRGSMAAGSALALESSGQAASGQGGRRRSSGRAAEQTPAAPPKPPLPRQQQQHLASPPADSASQPRRSPRLLSTSRPSQEPHAVAQAAAADSASGSHGGLSSRPQQPRGSPEGPASSGLQQLEPLDLSLLDAPPTLAEVLYAAKRPAPSPPSAGGPAAAAAAAVGAAEGGAAGAIASGRALPGLQALGLRPLWAAPAIASPPAPAVVADSDDDMPSFALLDEDSPVKQQQPAAVAVPSASWDEPFAYLLHLSRKAAAAGKQARGQMAVAPLPACQSTASACRSAGLGCFKSVAVRLMCAVPAGLPVSAAGPSDFPIKARIYANVSTFVGKLQFANPQTGLPQVGRHRQQRSLAACSVAGLALCGAVRLVQPEACLLACLPCLLCLPALQWGMDMLVEDGSMVVKARLAPQFMQECLGGWVGGWLAG